MGLHGEISGGSVWSHCNHKGPYETEVEESEEM